MRHLIQDTVMESDKKYHIQEVSPFPTGDHNAVSNNHDRVAKTNTNNKKDPEKKHRLGMARKKMSGGSKLVSWYQPLP